AGELAPRLCRTGPVAAGHAARHGSDRRRARAPRRQAAPARGAGLAAVQQGPREARPARRRATFRHAPRPRHAHESARMILYVVRHAIAEDAPAGAADGARKRPGRGRKKRRPAAGGLRASGVAPAIVLTSPLVRAVETAAIVVDALQRAPAPRELAALTPDVAPADTLKALRV